MSTRTHRRGGFTLLEIMIVIVLIGIVATIALPNLLEAEAHAEAAALQQDVDTIRKAWVQLLSEEDVQITDPELQLGGDTGMVARGNVAVRDSAPDPLAPFLTTLKTRDETVEVFDLDGAGKPQPERDATGRIVGVKMQTASVPRLLGPRQIRIRTDVVVNANAGSNAGGAASTTNLLGLKLGLPTYAVHINLTTYTPQADELLRLSLRHFKEAGFTVDYTPPRNGTTGFHGLNYSNSAHGILNLYFVP